VDREHDEVEAVDKRQALQPVQGGWRVVRHLHMQNLDTVKAKPGGVLDHLVNGIPFPFEVPVGVRRDPKSGTSRDRRLRTRLYGLGRGLGEKGAPCKAGALLQQRASRQLHGASPLE